MNDIEEVGFRGNIALKKKGTKHKWKKKELLELKKCQEDIIYFVQNYCKIISLDHGIIPFELYDYQKTFIKMMNENRFVIANQARQSGKCCHSQTLISIKNKKTGKIEKIPIGEFYDRVKTAHKK